MQGKPSKLDNTDSLRICINKLDDFYRIGSSLILVFRILAKE